MTHTKHLSRWMVRSKSNPAILIFPGLLVHVLQSFGKFEWESSDRLSVKAILAYLFDFIQSWDKIFLFFVRKITEIGFPWMLPFLNFFLQVLLCRVSARVSLYMCLSGKHDVLFFSVPNKIIPRIENENSWIIAPAVLCGLLHGRVFLYKFFRSLRQSSQLLERLFFNW